MNVTTNNTAVIITDIGNSYLGEPSLTCHTNLVECCRAGDQIGGTESLGMWNNPNGDVLLTNYGGGDFYIRRDAPQLIRLNRRNTAATSPTGLYCCVIPIAGGGEQTFCANLGNLCEARLCYNLVHSNNYGVSSHCNESVFIIILRSTPILLTHIIVMSLLTVRGLCITICHVLCCY